MFKVNPYRPGAGLMPTYLAGRDEDIENVTQMFEALSMNMPVQSIIFSGLRGVGKTVLINSLQKLPRIRIFFVNILKWKRETILFLRLPPVHKHF